MKPLKAMDVYENTIKANVQHYVITVFTPGVGIKGTDDQFATINDAIDAGKVVMANNAKVRTVMIYAIDHKKSHAMVGSIGQKGVKLI